MSTIAMLEAGRELDALISSKVMGVVWDESRCRVCGWPLMQTTALGCVADNCSMRPRPKRRADEPAPYSTDIAAAWRIVEAMHATGLNLGLGHAQGDAPGDPNLYAYFRKGRRFNPQANAPTAPLAICRAALAVIEATE